MKTLAKIFLLPFFMAGLYSAPAAAQDTAPQTPAQSPESQDFTRRLELSRSIHEIRPAVLQVVEALELLSEDLPEAEQERFVNQVVALMDMQTIERLSVDTMAMTFTPGELQAMYDYHSRPEARTIAEKLPRYQQVMQPEIARRVNNALTALEMQLGAEVSALDQGPAQVAP